MQNAELLMSKHLVHILVALGVNKKIRSMKKKLEVTCVLITNCC
jgi:hypothetical protein